MNKPIQDIHFTQPTIDGWTLRLFYYPARSTQKSKSPVVLCHGLAANKHSCDFGTMGTSEWETYSLASFISQGGLDQKTSFDVWVPELRGRGENASFHPLKHPERYNWCIDDYIQKDVPTIISTIRDYYKEKEGLRPKLFWVGKSMGGMIIYAYGETSQAKRTLKGVVTIGSPIDFTHTSPVLDILSRIAPRNFYIPINAADFLLKHPDIKEKFKETGANIENIDDDIYERYIAKGMNNTISSKVLSHFSVFFRHQTFCRYPQFPWLFDTLGRISVLKPLFWPHDYKQQLKRFTTPLLVLAGQNDDAAPPEDVSYASNHVGSKDVTFINFSKENGYSADYGHLDLNLGYNVKKEVYPVIYQWLLDRDG
ncbi:MAG: alpha/beta fold hydrolase [Candidatus Thermoplasmatota archaeon]|nr:alpha/beta fold hydrolase [Candidatus Thermoplasmatota archaeon]